MSALDEAAYSKAHSACAMSLAIGRGADGENPDEEGRMNMARNRQLSHVILNPELDDLATRGKSVSSDKLYTQGKDHGATLYR